MAQYWTTSKLLLRTAEFKGRLVNVSPLRIGSGRAEKLGSPIDLPVLRVNYAGEDLPYIPGSSLKGVFRSFSEGLAEVKGFKVCSGLAKSTCMELKSYNGIELGKYIERKLREGKAEEAMKAFWERACLMCKIFGAPSYSGKVTFEDAYPLGDKAPRLGVRAGIAIDRRTGAVVRRGLFQIEYVEPGTTFKFSVKCYNLPNYALGLLSCIIESLNSGLVKVGGFKTRGFGALKVEELIFKCKDYGVANGLLRPFKYDELDSEVDISGIATISDGWLTAEGEAAWRVLAKLKEAWERAEVKD